MTKKKPGADRKSRRTLSDKEKVEFKLKCIIPLAAIPKGTPGGRALRQRLLRQLHEKYDVSITSLKRWHKDYEEHGLSGLTPKYPREHNSAIKQGCAIALERIKELRFIERATVNQLIATVESEGLAEPGVLTRPTVQRILQECGLGSRELEYRSGGNKGALEDGEFFIRYEAPAPMFLLLADVTYIPKGIVVDDFTGKAEQYYMSAFIDDFSRFLWIKLSISQSQDIVNLLLRDIIIKENCVPRYICSDHGKIYVSNSFCKACSTIGAKRCLCPVRAGHAKGKIERPFKTHGVLEQLLTRCKEPMSFSAFEALCLNWCDEYNNTPHSALNGLTPAQAKAGTPYNALPLPSREVLDIAFATSYLRKLQPDATVSMFGIPYQVEHLSGLKRKDYISIEVHKDADGTPHVLQVLDDLTLVELHPLNPRDAALLKAVSGDTRHRRNEERFTQDLRYEYSAVLLARYREQLKAIGAYKNEEEFMKLMKIMLSPQLLDAAKKKELEQKAKAVQENDTDDTLELQKLLLLLGNQETNNG